MSFSLQDFPSGPLDHYRKKGSFDWKKLKIFIETEELVKFQNELYEVLRTHPEYQQPFLLASSFEQKRRSARQTFASREIKLITENMQDYKKAAIIRKVLAQFNSSAGAKFSLTHEMFPRTLKSLGTERHHEFIQKAANGEIIGCFSLTEIGHGSNVKGLKTTATYDAETQEFILHSPDFEGAKCWSGGLGYTATHALVYAQLYINKKSHGLHTFIVPIRDPKTLLPYQRIIVGEMGEKIGLNGIDNGFLMFDKYRIPRENLLNKNADVTSNGDYKIALKDSKDLHGASFATLSMGRVDFTDVSVNFGIKALTIAVRYAAVRKQFGPDGENEIPILEYQSHQYRLLPFLAAIYVVKFFCIYLADVMYGLIENPSVKQNKKVMAEIGMEIHAVSSACKPVAGWMFRDAIQECREACGGHGYLRAAGIGDVRNDHDPTNTFEGENHVLIQQTSNWLVKFWAMIEKGVTISSPLKSVDFLSNGLQTLQHRFNSRNVEELCKPENIMDAYDWLVCYLLKETKTKLDDLKAKDGAFWGKNNTQVFYAKSLAIAFVQRFFLQRMLIVISEASDPNIKKVLLKLFSLYGLWSLEKFLTTLYEGGYAQGSQPSQLIHAAILKLCSYVKDDAVSLIDAVAPPDFILNSVLGASDGQVYHRL